MKRKGKEVSEFCWRSFLKLSLEKGKKEKEERMIG